MIQKSFILILAFALSSQAFAEIIYLNFTKETKIQIQNDLNYMFSIEVQKQTTFHEKIFGPFNKNSYKIFIEDRIREIVFGNCSRNAIACFETGSPNRIYIDENYIKFSHPQIARLILIFHEARHTEYAKGNWDHDSCPNPFLDEAGREILSIWTGARLAGERGCDSTAFGSYGLSTILLKNISQFCTNCTEKVKMDADIYGIDQLLRIPQADIKKSILQDIHEKK